MRKKILSMKRLPFGLRCIVLGAHLASNLNADVTVSATRTYRTESGADSAAKNVAAYVEPTEASGRKPERS